MSSKFSNEKIERINDLITFVDNIASEVALLPLHPKYWLSPCSRKILHRWIRNEPCAL
jgi:hypothetical protein